MFEAASMQFEALGIKTGKISIDLPQMLKQKDDAVDGLTKGVAFLMKKTRSMCFWRWRYYISRQGAGMEQTEIKRSFLRRI
ncbi:MAG: hypothetical protein R3C40_06175 [Parvularculaceae bacterium]